MTGVLGPHGCEGFTNGAELLLDRLFLDGIPMRGHKSGMDALGENLEEGTWVIDDFKIRGDVQTDAEALPLAPSSGVFIRYYGREALGYS